MQFVDQMNGIEFTDDKYTPANTIILFDIMAVKYYTNMNLPEDIGEAYAIIQSLNIVETIYDIIGETDQYQSLLDCLEKLWDYNKTQKSGLNGLLDTVKGLLKNFDINKIADSLSGLSPELLEKLPDLLELKSMFTEVQPKEPERTEVSE